MSCNKLEIKGFIGEWGYSKSMIQNFLAEAGKSPVEIGVSSPGGEVDHAIDIYNQFAEHGNVTVIMSGFNASCGTLITLSAAKVKMYSNSFYLIHQVLSSVDVYDSMNEDDIAGLILELEAQKKNLEKVTLVLATMYAKKCKKTTAQILTLMKDEMWLNATEALAWGFVDEICEPVVQEDLLTNMKLVGMLNYAGLPLPVARAAQSGKGIPGSLDPEAITASILSKAKKFINSIFTMKQFSFLNTLLEVPSLESSEDGIYLNEVQANMINNALALNATLVKEHQIALNTLTEASVQSATERDIAIAQSEATLSDLQNVTHSLDAIDPSIAIEPTFEGKILAVRAFMAGKPAVTPVGVVTTEDTALNTLTENQKILYALPHMQED